MSKKEYEAPKLRELAEVTRLQKQLEAVKSVLWMAEQYAEECRGPELREYQEVMKVLEDDDSTS